MSGIQAEVPDGEVRIHGLKFAQADEGADAVMPSCVEEADMERQVHAKVCIMGTKHIKGVSEIKSFQVTVPSPVRIGVREMAPAGAVGGTVFVAFAGFMSIRGVMGMDTGAIAGKGDAIGGDKAVFEGGDKCGKPEELLEPFFIMKGKGFMIHGIIRQ